MYWLVGMENSVKDDSNKILVNYQKSFINYIKTDNVNELAGSPPSVEGIIWFIYAFF